MKAIVYDLTLESPVLITDISGDPNSATSLPYIPGSTLRGAIVTRYLRNNGGFNALDSDQRAMFLNESTRYLNAYPIADTNRMVPTPTALRRDKRTAMLNQVLFNLSHPYPVTPKDFRERSAGTPFVWVRGDTATEYKPLWQINLHTQRNAELGRSVEGQTGGAIYRYEAISEGSTFRAAILAPDKHELRLKDTIANSTLWVGRARRAGYGHVRVTNVEVLDDWSEAESPPTRIWFNESEKLIQVVFTSDGILRDDQGQITLDPLPALETALRAGLTIDPTLTYAASRTISGFNRKWGLPLTQTPGIEAGSTFVFKVNGQHSPDAIRDLENNGIGERRGEGFGRILVNRFTEPEYQLKEIAKQVTTTGTVSLSDEEYIRAKFITERIMRARLDEDLVTTVNSKKITGSIKNSQLSRLRNEVHTILRSAREDNPANIEQLSGYLDSVKSRDSTRKQFENASVDTSNLSNWLRSMIEDPMYPWQNSTTRIVLTGADREISSGINDRLAREYTLRMIEAVLQKSTSSESGVPE